MKKEAFFDRMPGRREGVTRKAVPSLFLSVALVE